MEVGAAAVGVTRTLAVAGWVTVVVAALVALPPLVREGAAAVPEGSGEAETEKEARLLALGKGDREALALISDVKDGGSGVSEANSVREAEPLREGAEEALKDPEGEAVAPSPGLAVLTPLADRAAVEDGTTPVDEGKAVGEAEKEAPPPSEALGAPLAELLELRGAEAEAEAVDEGVPAVLAVGRAAVAVAGSGVEVPGRLALEQGEAVGVSSGETLGTLPVGVAAAEADAEPVDDKDSEGEPEALGERRGEVEGETVVLPKEEAVGGLPEADAALEKEAAAETEGRALRVGAEVKEAEGENVALGEEKDVREAGALRDGLRLPANELLTLAVAGPTEREAKREPVRSEVAEGEPEESGELEGVAENRALRLDEAHALGVGVPPRSGLALPVSEGARGVALTRGEAEEDSEPLSVPDAEGQPVTEKERAALAVPQLLAVTATGEAVVLRVGE